MITVVIADRLGKGQNVAKGVEQAVELAVEMNKNNDLGIPVPYYVEDVSNKVVKLIQSYTDVVNKVVWRK